jgi:hypothetical protein
MTAETATHQNVNGGKHHKKNKHSKHAGETLVGAEEQPVVNGIDVEFVELSEHETSVPLSKFVNRITSIPILQDGATVVHGYVNQNYIGRYALTTAGSTLTTVNKFTQPYQRRLQDHIDKVDELSCKSLDLIEEHFPLVKQPTVEIFEAVKKPPMQVYDGVKTRIDSTITAPATNIAKGVNQRVTVVVDNVEAVVDRWLPAEGEHAHADETNQATRVYKLSLDVSNRLIHRVNIQLEKNHVPRSKEDIIKLAETSALLKAAFEKINALNETLRQWVVLSAQAAKDRLPPSVTQRVTDLTVSAHKHYEQTREFTSKRLSDLSAELIKQLDTVSEFIKAHSPALPSYVQQRLEPLIQFAHIEYEIIRSQAIRSDLGTIAKARQIVALNQDQVLPILQSSVQDVQEQLKHYTEAATHSKDKVVVNIKTRLQAFGVTV